MHLATVLARGGSKGVPGKNIRLIAGKPLIAHTVEHALAAGVFDAVAVSSDSADILAAGKKAGATHLVERPAEMASDEAGKLPAIRHCVAAIEQELGCVFETITDLQPTSPTRHPDDIRAAVAMQKRLGVSNVISGTPAKSSPYFNLVELQADGSVALSKPPAADVVRRQDAPRCFDLNGSIYVWRRDALMDGDGLWFADTHLYEMPAERSVDIDTELDFAFADFVMRR
ncbi:acylneuraminate cytidylyltransferase family protein [Pyruvatibacter sp.]|uniref:acylneuraminate cytidylyltransferase family protein n=1 Tax=Pyruvatibacter sp. TaxID=1981328 RepID=UPI0032EFB4B6